MAPSRLSTYRLGRRRLLTLTATLTGAALLRLPPRIGAQPAGVERHTLPNGLVVIVEERRIAESVAFQLSARAGSRDDEELPGLTAFTVRAMTGGTRRRPSQIEIFRTATLVGGTFNGSFGTEQDAFTALVPATEADTGFDLLSDIAGEPLLSEGIVAGFKPTVLQTLALRRADPAALLNDLYTAAIYDGHPASTPTNGTPQSIQALSRTDVITAHRRFWGAANLVLTIVGEIEIEEALTKAEQYFGSLPPGTLNVRPPASPMPRSSSEVVRGTAGEQQMQFRIGFHAPNLHSEDRYPMAVLNAIMGGAGGRFFVEVRSERGLAYTATSSYSPLTDTGNWFGFAGTEPANLDEAIAAARDLIRGIRDVPVRDTEIQERITQIAGNQILADEANTARAARLSAVEVLGDVSTEEYVRRIRQVTAADVQRVAQTYLDLDRALTVIVGPRPMT